MSATSTADALEAELDWLGAHLLARIGTHFRQAGAEIPPPPAVASGIYADRIAPLSSGARLTVILALAPLLRPEALDPLFVRNANLDRGYAEFGGRRGAAPGGFLPTVETALFLTGDGRLATRLAAMATFAADAPLLRLIALDPAPSGEPWTASAIRPRRRLQAALGLLPEGVAA